VSARTRTVAVVAAAAATVAAVAVGAAALQSGPRPAAEGAALRPSGAPPMLLELGVRADQEAAELRRAERLWDEGERAEARAILARYDSVEAEVGAALARWPDGAVPALRQLAERHPGRADVLLNLGFALFWSGERDQALEAWREARRVQPDSLAAVRAGDLLFPHFARGLPTFVPSFDPPEGIAALPAERQLERLRRDAEEGGAREKILYGVALQRIGRPVSALREYDAAAALAPAEPEAQVAAAVGRFDKERPSEALSLLGPLAGRFPHEPTVRFHLGLLLLWMGDVEDARRQLDRARSADPDHPLAAEASRFLERLEDMGTDAEDG
jgi:tetratricopeptide (TPR) repeat protein